MSMEKTAIVLDTNVAVVANGMAEQADKACMYTCTVKLLQITRNDENLLLLDDKYLILSEYQNRLDFSGQPGPGDGFFKWLWERQADERHCRIVPVTSHEDRGFEEFPDDADLASFDMDDRKFVAVALASRSSPQVLNASDTDWWHHRDPLRKRGIDVVFLCPDLMNREAQPP